MKLRLFRRHNLFHRFTSAARRAVFYGHHFAKYEGLSEISCRHLLIGIDIEAQSLLPLVGLNEAGLGWLRAPTHAPRSSIAVPEAIPLTEHAKAAIRKAADIAEQNDNYPVEIPHLLAAVIESDEQLKQTLLGYNLAEDRVDEVCKNLPPQAKMCKAYIMNRSGVGYDLHRLVEGRKLVIGGVEVPFDKGPAGHSDGDVLAHAICDALLGAAGLGDIGTHFPDTDPKWKGASSLVFLEAVQKMLDERELKIRHIDAVVILERPKLGPHFDAMRSTLARALDLRVEHINLKAKTNEGVDAIGRGEAIAAQAIATIEA